jgi:lipopolysaccharide transport system ATP-binding protein
MFSASIHSEAGSTYNRRQRRTLASTLAHSRMIRDVPPTPRARAVVVSVRNLGKRYWLRRALPATFQHAFIEMMRGVRSSPFWALRDVSFDILPGESVGIIGSNGAGKSTLLRLLCGLGRPTTGSVNVEGRLAGLLELGAGFHPHLTGRENLFVSAIVSGRLRRRKVAELFDTIVDFAELRDFIDQPLRTYSLGMQMRLGFSVAIHVDPSVMIIDEGLSVGDGHFQQKCLERIEAFRRGGKTLVMVSHDMGIIRSFCSRAIWLRRGTLVRDGALDKVLPEYESVIEQEILSVSRDAGPAST